MAFRMDEHLDRLTSSATTLEMNIPYSREKIVEGCIQTVEANNLEKGLIKIMAYWGSEEAIALVPDDPLDVTIFSIPESPGL